MEPHRREFVERRQVPVLVPGCARECARVRGRQTGCAVDRRNEGGIFRTRSDGSRGARHVGVCRRTPETCRRVPAGSTRTVREFEVVTGIGEGNPAAKTICVVVVDRSAAWTGSVLPRSDPIRLDRAAGADRPTNRSDHNSQQHPATTNLPDARRSYASGGTKHRLIVPVVQTSSITFSVWTNRDLRRPSVGIDPGSPQWRPSGERHCTCFSPPDRTT